MVAFLRAPSATLAGYAAPSVSCCHCQCDAAALGRGREVASRDRRPRAGAMTASAVVTRCDIGNWRTRSRCVLGFRPFFVRAERARTRCTGTRLSSLAATLPERRNGRLGLAVAGRRGTRSRQCIASAGRRKTVPGRCADRASSPDAFAAVAHAIRRGGEYRLRYGARDCSSTVTRSSQGSDPPATDRCDSVADRRTVATHDGSSIDDRSEHWKVSESQPHTFFRTTPRDRVPMSPETPSRTLRGRRETCKELETAIGRALLRGHPGR